MIDLISVNLIALNKDQIIVEDGMRSKILVMKLQLSIIITITGCSITPKYTPATTIVELCNKAEIGVGADMAFSNQEENGN